MNAAAWIDALFRWIGWTLIGSLLLSGKFYRMPDRGRLWLEQVTLQASKRRPRPALGREP